MDLSTVTWSEIVWGALNSFGLLVWLGITGWVNGFVRIARDAAAHPFVLYAARCGRLLAALLCASMLMGLLLSIAAMMAPAGVRPGVQLYQYISAAAFVCFDLAVLISGVVLWRLIRPRIEKTLDMPVPTRERTD
jgi:hypothetical protein